MSKCGIQLTAVAAPRSRTAGRSRIYVRVGKHTLAASSDVACFRHETGELTLNRQVVGLKIPSPEAQWHCGRARSVRKWNHSRADVRQRNWGYTGYQPGIRNKRLTRKARSRSKPARVEVRDRHCRKGISQEAEIVGVRAYAVSGADDGLARHTIGDSQSRIELPDSDLHAIVFGNAT